ncbi:MAG: hypothetical protein ACI39F_05725 [Acutalibacteraceae bacterium]
MSIETNIGEQTTVENGEAAENSEVIEGTADKDTNEEISADNNDSDNDTEGENAADGDKPTSGENENDEVFLTTEDGNKILRSQAENFALQGYEYQSKIKPLLDKFSRIAANSFKEDGSAYGSLDELADRMIEAIDNNLLERCREDAGGDEEIAQELYQSRKAVRDKDYNDSLEAKEREKREAINNQTQKVAAEFENLQKVFPEIKSYGELSAEVKNYAARNNVSLLEAKLLVDHENQKAVQRVNDDKAAAAAKSTGSQSGSGGAEKSAEIEAMLRGMRR